MYYYNPYYMMYPAVRTGLFGTIRNGFRSINFGNILNGTQRTLNLVNQAIPLVKQMRPVIRNAGTMFRIMNEFKKFDRPNNTRNNNKVATYSNEKIVDEYGEGPKFFV